LSHKEKYKTYCASSAVSLFFQPEWLDVCRHPWNVIMAEIEGHTGFWIFHVETKMGLKFIRNPHLTPYTGLFFTNDTVPESIREKLIQQLIVDLPSIDVLELNLDPRINASYLFNALNNSTKITNHLTLKDEETIFANFKPALKRQIKKAHKSLHIYEADDIDLFYSLHQKTFEKQGKQAGISLEIYMEYWSFCKQHYCGRLFFIADEQDNVHASCWLAYDDDTSYYLAGGSDSAFYGSGAMSGLMWHIIRESILMKKRVFDFEGSMLPSVNRFFRNFSPEEKEYIYLKKINSVIYKLLKGK